MLNLIVQGLAFLIPLLLVYLNFKWHSFWKIRNVPGPTPWPIFGTTIYYFFRPKIDVDLEWDQKYGKVYGTFEGYEPILKVNDSQLVDHIMVKNHKQFVDRPLRGVHSDGMKSWVFFSKGDQWINKRLLISPMFTSIKLNFYSKVMTECIEEFFKQIETPAAPMLAIKEDEKFAKKETSKQAKLVSRNHFMSLALDIMCRVLHSCKINTYQGSESDFHKRAFAFSTFDVGYWIVWNLLPKRLCAYFQLDLSPASKFEYLNKLSQTLLDQRRRELKETSSGQSEPKKSADIIQMMLDAKIPEKRELVYDSKDDLDSHFNNNLDHQALEQIHQDQMDNTKISFREFSDTERCSQMTFFFIAGFDTTSMSLTFCFHSLARYQIEQQTVYEEIIALQKEKKTEILNWQDVTQLEKLDCFIAEVLRIYPPVTVLNRVVAPKEGLLLESNPPIQLPHETIIGCDPFVIHRDPQNWDHPEVFDMSRFSKENKSKIARGSYLPFGIGPRNCAGFRFASLNLKQVVANVLLRYQVIPMPQKLAIKKPIELAPEVGSQYETHPFFLQLKKNCFVLLPRN